MPGCQDGRAGRLWDAHKTASTAQAQLRFAKQLNEEWLPEPGNTEA